MEQTDILLAPEVYPPRPTMTKWQVEHRAFQQMLPQLLQLHRGKFVAIHEGRVVATGDDQISVANEAFAKFGYVAMHVGFVSDEPPRVFRSPSPRTIHGETA